MREKLFLSTIEMQAIYRAITVPRMVSLLRSSLIDSQALDPSLRWIYLYSGLPASYRRDGIRALPKTPLYESDEPVLRDPRGHSKTTNDKETSYSRSPPDLLGYFLYGSPNIQRPSDRHV